MQTERMPSRAEVVGWIEDAIRDGAYGTSGKLPSESELMNQHGASRNTVRDALRDLQALGVVESRSRLGWFLRADPRRDYPLADVSPEGWDAYCRREGLIGREHVITLKSKAAVEFRAWQVRDAVTGEWDTWALHLDARPGRSDLTTVASRAGVSDELEALDLPRRAAVLEVERAGERYVFDARLVRFLA